MIIKKDGSLQNFDETKIINAIEKSAKRCCVNLTENEKKEVIKRVKNDIDRIGKNVNVSEVHNMVECALECVNGLVAKSYKEYRNYKKDFSAILDKVWNKKLSLKNADDRSNANADSSLVTTQKAIVYNEMNSLLYDKFFLNDEERKASEEGYIYIHDKGSRLDTMNCSLLDMQTILSSGFRMGNIEYTEPKSLDVAFGVIADIMLNAGSFQYGGLTVCEFDKLIAPYAEKSYQIYLKEFKDISNELGTNIDEKKADEYAYNKVKRDMEQGVQQIECRFNSVNSARGDYPFTSITFGLGTSRWETLFSSVCMKVRKEGQGQKVKVPVLFPKLSFFYDEELHGEGKQLEWLFDEAIDCSSKSMYPDFIALTGDGYQCDIYKKYKTPISRMGCVDPKEIVIYKINNVTKVTSIKNMWDDLSSVFKIHSQKDFGYDSGYVIPLKGVCIFDRDKFVNCKCIIKNDETSDWYKVSLTNGRTLICTGDHPWTIDNKIKITKELNLNDTVEVIDSLPEICGDSEEKDKAWLEALIMCDGSYDHTIMICLGLDEYDIVNKVKEISQRLFNYTPTIKEQHRGKKGNYVEVKFLLKEAPKCVNDFTKKLREDFKSLRKESREIPEWIFTSTKETQLSFLAGIIDADGYINDSRKSPVIQIGSTNKVLSLQQMALAQILGIPVHIYENHYNKKNQEKTRYKIEFKFISGLEKYISSTKKLKHVLNESNHTKFQLSKITKIEKLNISQNSYDVTTESEHFYCSGVRSHNCRAQLSPWFIKGGMTPADENDKPVFVGRFNLGAIALHFPMIVAKAKEEHKDFFEVLEYYMDIVRGIHKKTVEFISHKKAGINPLGFCEGGFLNGHLNPDEEIGMDFLKPMTISFGVIALNEASVLMTGKKISEDNSFAIDVMKWMSEYIAKYKKIDGILYALYGVPGESLVIKQVEQFRKKYGIVKDVSDHDYTTNSFHCCVRDDITPIEKQDIEYPMYHLCTGGNIQYCRYPLQYNIDAIKTLVRRAMKMGFYEGVNLQLDFCPQCGTRFIDKDACPKCGSEDIIRIDRMNGYLGLSKIRGKSFFSEGKLKEFDERVSM